MSEVDTQHLSMLVGRLRSGDESAREELIRASLSRLEGLTRKMLRCFPRVRRWEETGDVLQNALVRLDRALRAVAPESSRAFFGLAAEQIRRELLDLARHYHGPQGLGRHCLTNGFSPGGESAVDFDPPEGGASQAELDRWAEFHSAVERLPADEREVMMLTFYHGWTQAQIAELFAVDQRTVRRRWRSACLRLSELLGGELPTL